MTYANLEKDRAFARSMMPRSTEIEIGGVIGFTYTFTCEFQTTYTMFAWFNGSRYKVKLVAPELEKTSKLGHDTHLFSDGTLCLEATMTGCATLSDAYAKSVVWANGHSIFRQTGQFPFSANNL